MGGHGQQQPPPPGGGLREKIDTAWAWAQVLAFPVEVWATRPGTWGTRYLTVHSVLGVVWPFLAVGLCGRHPRAGELVLFAAGTLGWLVVHRLAGLVRRRRGYACHSRYWGRCWLARGDGWAAERRGRLLAALLAAGAGYLLIQAGGGPLGLVLLAGGAAKLVADGLAYRAVASRLQDMADARDDQAFYLERFRERTW